MTERDIEAAAVGLMVGMLVTCTTVLVSYLLWWRSEQHATKRTPMTGGVVPGPGQTVRMKAGESVIPCRSRSVAEARRIVRGVQ